MAVHQPRRPNFVLFLTDQQHADHLGCAGEPLLKTPAIDALAAQGTRFSACHVATPICQPNRASLLTGRLPSLHGVAMNGRELSHAEVSFVERLRRSGWRTALVGKAHFQNITDTPPAWPAPGEPRAQETSRSGHPGLYGQERASRWRTEPDHELPSPYYGFEHVRLSIGHGDDLHGHWRRWLSAQDPQAETWLGPDNAIPTPKLALARRGLAWRTRLPEACHPTRWVADEACTWLRKRARAEEPFFLQCSFADPHHPYTPPEHWWGRHDPADITLPASHSAELLDPPPPVQALRQAAAAAAAQGTAPARAGYAAFAASEQEVREGIALNHDNLAFIDDAVARVCQTLQSLGLDDNTVIVFSSDHGDLMGDRGLLLKGGLHYRSLTRVPLIWRDTANQRSQRPRIHDGLVQSTDLPATVLSRAELPLPQGMQGQNLMPVMTANAHPAERKALLIEEEGQRRDFGLGQRVRLRTLLTPEYRYTLYADEPWGELYDLRQDPHELVNLWHHPKARATRGELAEQLAQLMARSAETCPYPTAAA